MQRRTVAIAALMISAAGPARAQVETFQQCDGYGAPNRQGDGMTEQASGLFGLFVPEPGRGDMRRRNSLSGRQGVSACDAALADSRLVPAYALRRASLLRARGVHRMSEGDDQAALADFDLADGAVVSPDSYYRRSFTLGMRLLRALAEGRARGGGVAAGTLPAIAAERPYDSDLGFAAARLELAATRDWAAYAANLRALARYDPNRIAVLFTLALLRQQFAEVAALHPFVRLDVPAGRGGYVVVGREERVARNIVLRIELDGANAYALAALGQGAAARDAVEGIQRRLAQIMAEPERPPPGGRRDDYDRRRRQWQFNRLVQRRADEAVARWRRLVALRADVGEGRAAEALAGVLALPARADPVVLDLMEAAHRALPATPALSGETVAALRGALERDLDAAARIDLAGLIAALPETEVPARLPSYGGGADSAITPNGGYMSRAGPIEGARTIRFGSGRGTLAMVGELGFLRAAELARESGKRGFIVLGRRALERTLNVQTYGQVDERPTGFEAELDVLLVDPDALPAGFEDAGWRVVDAEATWAALSPLYRVERPARR